MNKKTDSFTGAILQYRTEVMGMAMFSIMLFHQYFFSVFPFNLFHNFGFWGVDIFLFLSGMGMVNSLAKNSVKTFYQRRFVRIVPSCLLCGTLKYLVFLCFSSSLYVLKEGLNLGAWSVASLDLWFVHTIIILYVISPLLFNLIKKHPAITLSVIIVCSIMNGIFIKPVVGYDWLSPIGIFCWTMERLFVFAAGMFVAINKDQLNINNTLSAVFLLVAICLNLLGKSGMSFVGIRACQLSALAVGVPALILINIFVLKRVLPPPLLKFFRYFGTYSLELYLVHEFIFWSLKVSMVNTTPYVLCLLGFVLACLLATLCKQCVQRLHIGF